LKPARVSISGRLIPSKMENWNKLKGRRINPVLENKERGKTKRLSYYLIIGGTVVKQIEYIVGDAVFPGVEGNKIIAHICNDVGGWGAGFVLALSRRWKEPEESFLHWFRQGAEAGNFSLGLTQFVKVEEDIWVANMIAHTGLEPRAGIPPIRYEALAACLETVGAKANKLGASVHMPRIGCGLAGGNWDRVEPIIQEQLCEKNVIVYVYDLPRRDV
jgi:O-acetyl-ADP-ribose deacetylase (regulator of RNase III)